MDEYRKYEPLFGSWYLKRIIGKGSFGKVFEIQREEYGTTYKAALKIIAVPQDDDDIRARMTEESDPDSVSEYYEGILREIINENEIMAQLKGNSNIVSYEDHQILPHEDGIGYDILIRMELLTPLIDRLVERGLTEEEVVRLGIDMCKALETCHKKNIIHRDIKPQNIFISDTGDFKLGDFGIARTMEKTTGGMSKKGTYKYMAPEVFRGEVYDSTVDIYSLGIVLYSLLNGNRGPFLPPPPAKVTHNDEEEARIRRFRGEPIPAPKDAGSILVYIIQKACANDPEDRYRTATQMRRDLESYLDNYDSPSLYSRVDNPTERLMKGTDGETTMLDERLGSFSHRDPANSIIQEQYLSQPNPILKYMQTGKKNIIIISMVIAGVIVGIAAGVIGYMVVQPEEKTPPVKEKEDTLDLCGMMTTPEFSGYNGSGVMENELVVDDSKWNVAIDNIKKEEKRTQLQDFLGSISYTVDIREGLSNGDEIKVSAEYDSNKAEEIGIKITGTEDIVTVSGLKDFPEYLAGATEFNGHYYRVVNESMYYSEAKKACEAENGHLATITSQEEQDFIMSLIEENGTKYNYWLGGEDAEHEGTWIWITGEPWSYTNWREEQPDDGSIGEERSQDYLQICMVSSEDPGRYGKWWDNSDDAVSKNYMEAPYYKDTQYAGYIIEWDGLS